jgi:hypothetical protein
MKIDFKAWFIIAVALGLAALAISFTTDAYPTRALRTPTLTDHLAPLDYRTYKSARRDLPADFEREVAFTATLLGSTPDHTAEITIRRNADAAYEVITIDGPTPQNGDSTKPIIRRAPLRPDLAVTLINLWYLELNRLLPASGAPVPIDATKYYFSYREPDGKIRLGQATAGTNASTLLPVADLLNSYVLSEPAHRAGAEQALEQLAAATVAKRLK